jgi:flagellin
MLSVQTNVTSLIAQNNLRIDTNFQNQTIQELTSGYRINSSGDDPAGLAIANGYRDQEAQLTQGIQNANNGISTLQIVDGGMNNISQILDRLQTLATESASGTFTGDRGVLNSEFQGLITEVNRQAQAIGLNQNGSLAKSLSVYIGGGQASATSTAATNSTVQIDLTGATVDAKSLGLVGMQALGGTAGTTDIGNSSTTSVANILAQNTTPVSDQTTFYFSGAGFSGANKIAVNVNTSSVSDVSSLVTAINDAIQNAGNEATPAASAFAAANIQATVNTDSSGKQQLAFTSSTSAFQVQAGDKVSNALLGNFNDPTVNAVAATMGSTFSGGNTAVSGTALANAGNITVQISGASLSSPVVLTLNSADTTVGGAITDLETQVAGNSALAGAGVSLTNATTPSAGAPLVFHSASGEQLQVMVSGDTANALGMGSFVAAPTAGTVDYDQITGAAYSTSQNYGSATLDFSINGAASAGSVAINMTAGSATAATMQGTANANTIAINPNNNALNLVVDGQVKNVTLTANPASTLNNIADQINTQVGSNIASVVNNQLTLTDTTKGAGGTLELLNGSANTALGFIGAQVGVVAQGTSASAADVANQINQAVAGNATLAAAGIQATVSSGALKITSTNNTNFRVGVVGGSAAAASITGATAAGTAASAASVTGTAGSFTIANGVNDALNVAIDGTTYNLTLNTTVPGTPITGANLATEIQGMLTTDGSSATVAYSGTTHQFTITSGTTGTNSSVQILAGSANTTLGLTAGTVAGAAATSGTQELGTSANYTFNGATNDQLNLVIDGTAATISLASLAGATVPKATVLSTLQTDLAAYGATASFDGNGKLNITTTATGSNQSVQVLAGSANTILGLTATGLVSGTNATNATATGSQTGPFTISTGTNDTLDITVSGYNSGSAQAITLAGGAGQSAQTIADTINGTLVGAHASAVNGQVVIQADDASSTLTISSATHDAAATLGLTEQAYNSTAASAANFVAGTAIASNVAIDQGLTNTVDIKIDGTDHNVTLVSGTAAQVAANITSQLGGVGTAFVDGTGNLQVKVNATGSGHNVQIASGTALGGPFNAAPGNATAGVNATAGALSSSAQAGPFNLYGAELSVTFDTGGTQNIVFSGATETAGEIVNDINSQLTGGGKAYLSGGAVMLVSNTVGAGSSVTVGGSAAATLGLSTTTATGTAGSALYTINGTNNNLTVSVDGGVAHTITLAQQTYTASAMAQAIQTALTAYGVTASASNGFLQMSSGTTGANSSLLISASTNDAATTLGLTESVTAKGTMQDVGFGQGAGSAFAGIVPGAPNAKVVNAGGATAVTGLTFAAITSGADSQAITVSATNANGALQSTTVNLQNSGTTRTGASIDAAVQAINTALQKTDNPTLQSIVAVKDDSSGSEKIDFISSLAAFQVSVGGTASGTGVGTALQQGTTLTATSLAGGSTADISTQQGGETAVAEVTAAVSALGSAQANIGKAQNTLNYAIGLAESQDTNLAAAQSSVRDADMATEAANLTKAQVLQQSAIAAMVQANSAPQNVLTLLRG